jgi:hypothetical protein
MQIFSFHVVLAPSESTQERQFMPMRLRFNVSLRKGGKDDINFLMCQFLSAETSRVNDRMISSNTAPCPSHFFDANLHVCQKVAYQTISHASQK